MNCKLLIVWRKKLRNSVCGCVSLNNNICSPTYLSLSKTKMVEDEQWRRISSCINPAVTFLPLMASHILPYYHNPVLFCPNRKFIGHHHRSCGKLLKTRIRVPRSSAISDGGISHNTLVSEVSQRSSFFFFFWKFSPIFVDWERRIAKISDHRFTSELDLTVIWNWTLHVNDCELGCKAFSSTSKLWFLKAQSGVLRGDIGG